MFAFQILVMYLTKCFLNLLSNKHPEYILSSLHLSHNCPIALVVFKLAKEFSFKFLQVKGLLALKYSNN